MKPRLWPVCACLFLALLFSERRAIAAPEILMKEMPLGALDGCYEDRLLREGFAACPGNEIATVCKSIHADPLAKIKPDSCALGALAMWHACLSSTDTICTEAGQPGYKADFAGEVQFLQGRAAGVAAGAVPSADIFLSGVAGFFLTRAQLELALFAKDQVASGLCAKDTHPASSVLLPNVCKLLNSRSSDGGHLLGLPKAAKEDIARLPMRLLDELLKQTPSAEYRDVACYAAAIAPGAAKLAGGRLEKLFASANVVARPAHCDQKRWEAMAPLFDALDIFAGALAERDRAFRAHDVSHVVAEIQDVVKPEALPWLKKNAPALGRFAAALLKVKSGSASSSAQDREELVDASLEMIGLVGSGLTGKAATADIEALTGSVRAFSRGEYVLGALQFFSLSFVQASMLQIPSEQSALRKLVTELQKHLQLVTSVAEAKTADEVQKALEAAAAPLQSWRQYRRRTSVFIAGAAGIGGGYELPAASDARKGGFLAPFLPIGLEMGTPLGESSSFNLFVPIIDLGALASARITDNAPDNKGKDGEASVTANPDFGAVFAPGAMIGFGFGNSPITLYLGGSIAPVARKYFLCDVDCDTSTTVLTGRFYVMIGVDLPVFALY